MGEKEVVKIDAKAIRRSMHLIQNAKTALKKECSSYVDDSIEILEEFNCNYADAMGTTLNNMRDLFGKTLLQQLEQYEKGVEDVVKSFEEIDLDSRKHLREIEK